MAHIIWVRRYFYHGSNYSWVLQAFDVVVARHLFSADFGIPLFKRDNRLNVVTQIRISTTNSQTWWRHVHERIFWWTNLVYSNHFSFDLTLIQWKCGIFFGLSSFFVGEVDVDSTRGPRSIHLSGFTDFWLGEIPCFQHSISYGPYGFSVSCDLAFKNKN